MARSLQHKADSVSKFSGTLHIHVLIEEVIRMVAAIGTKYAPTDGELVCRYAVLAKPSKSIGTTQPSPD